MIQRGNTSGALQQIKKCKKQLRTELVKSPHQSEMINLQLARVLRLEGQIYSSLEKFSRALQALEHSKSLLDELPKNSDNKLLLANVSYSIGLLRMVNDDLSEAAESFTTSMDLYSRLHQFNEATEIGFRLIELYYKQQDYDNSLKMVSITEKFVKKEKDKQKKSLNLTRLKILESKSKLKTGQIEESLKLLEKAKEQADKDKNYPSLLLVLAEIADIHFKELHINKAEEYYLQLHDLAVSTKTKRFEALALMQLGVISLRTSRLEEGKKRLLRGLQIRLELGDKVGAGQVLIELGRIGFLTSRSDSDLRKALDFLTRAQDLFVSANYDYGQAQAYELITNIQIRLREINTAYKSVNHGLKLFKKFKDRDGEARLLTQLAIILDQLNRQNEIEPVINKAEKHFTQLGNKQGLAEVLHIKSQLEKDPTKALRLLKQCQEIYSQIVKTRPELEPVLNIIDNRISELSG